jgi:trk system potassium uptake protein TrkH
MSSPKLEDRLDGPLGRRPSLLWHTVGLALMFCGAAMLVSAGVEAASAERSHWGVLLGLGVATATAGYVMRSATMIPERIPVIEVFVSVSGVWAVISVVGMLPYLLSGTITAFDEALFESVSGFTTTGATILGPDPDNPARYAASDGILFWRAITQWMGGMGVIALVVAVLPSIGSRAMGMMAAEAPGPTGERLTPRVRQTARRLWTIYLGFTGAVIGAYLVLGMSVYDAVTHAFTTVSTGGFSPHTASMAHFDSAALEWMAVLFMFVAGSSFPLLYKAIRGRPGPLLRSVEFQAYVIIVAVAVVAVFLTADAGPRNAETFRHAAFTIVSIISTTGYASTDFVGNWADAALAIVLILMPLGAMSGSTAGGVKVIRILAVASFAHRATLAQLHQRLVRPVRLGPDALDERVAGQIVGHLILSLAAFGGGSVLIILSGADLVTGFSAAATAFGNVGPGLGEVGADFRAISPFGRLVAVGNMVLGRLEIYPILLALAKVPITSPRTLLHRVRQD